MNSPKILLIDVETAPIQAYSWGLYDQNINPVQIIHNAYMLCWAAKWLDKKEIMFDSIFNHREEFKKNPKNDSTIAKTIWPLLDSADIIIAHNGDNFDIKWLNTIFWRNKLNPVSDFKTIDTCKIARSQFKLGSNKLEEIAKLRGFGEKLEHEGFSLWIKCMHGDEKAWKKMEQYNKQDIKLLEFVYLDMKPYIKNHPNLALYYDESDPICPNCGEKNTLRKKGYSYTSVNKYQRYVCNKCGKNAKSRKTVLAKEKSENILSPL